MNYRVYEELSRAVQREGQSLSENPQRIKALLMDACPDSRTEISLLVGAAEDEIPTRLARSSESVFRDSEIARAIADLKRTRRLDNRAADWVVRSWAAVLGLGPPPSSGFDDDQATFVPRSAPPGSRGPGAFGPPNAGIPPNSFPGSRSAAPGPSVPPYGPPPGSVPPVAASAPPPPHWNSGPPPMSGPAGPSPSTWHAAPAGLGPSPSSWAGPQPPLPPIMPGSPPPARRGKGRMLAIIGGAAMVVVLAVVGFAVLRPGPAQPPQPQPVPSPTPAPPTDNGKVNFKITATLPSNGLAETATVYSFGKSVGDLTVNKQSPTFSMPVTAEPGNVDYQVQLTIIFDDPQQTRVSLTGSGAITAFEGAEYSVRITKNQQGEFGATLEAEQNGT